MQHLYPYDDVITTDGKLWAVRANGENLQAVVTFDNVSDRFLHLLPEACVNFITRSRICQLGLDAELNAIERPAATNNKLECSITLSAISNSSISSQVLDFISRCHKQISIGKLFITIPERQLTYQEILEVQNAKVINSPLIEGQILPSDGNAVIVPLDNIVYNYSRNLNIDGEHILYLLTEGTRRDLNFVRMPSSASAPHNVSPQSFLLTRLSQFNVKEHFALIEGLTLGTQKVSALKHLSARLFDPLSYRETASHSMIEVTNTSETDLLFDGVQMTIYRSEKRRCSIQRPSALRLSKLLSPETHLGDRMDQSLKGTAAGKGRRVLHAAFAVDAQELDRLDELKNTAIGEAMERNGSRDRSPVALEDCPEYDILREINAGHIKAKGFLLSYYFPRWDIGSWIETCSDKLGALLFRRPSFANDLFFSEYDVLRLKFFNKLGLNVIWIRDDGPQIYVTRQNSGFFMRSELASTFQDATFFACYGSSVSVSDSMAKELPAFFRSLADLFGDIGVITGGGPGLMEAVNRAALEVGILSASCCLETEFSVQHQEVNKFCNISMYFDEYCRHIRQNNFAIARFPIFFPGGLGTLEEVGIEMCNWKLGIRERAPHIFVGREHWKPLFEWFERTMSTKMIDSRILNNLFVVDSLSEAVGIYENFLAGPDHQATR